MAKIGQFLNVTDIRGKLGGTVFTAGRSGATLRARVKGKNPKSPAQVAVRVSMTAAARSGITLSGDQLTAWKAYANALTFHNKTSGNAYHPAWNTVYNASFRNLSDVGMTPTSPIDAPVAPWTPDTITVTANGAGTGDIVFTASDANSTDATTILYVGIVPGYTRQVTEKDLRIAGVFQFTSGTLTQTVGGLISGQNYAVGVKFVNTDTGQASPIIFQGQATAG